MDCPRCSTTAPPRAQFCAACGAMLAQPQSPAGWEGRELRGYRIERKLGEGGMGEVFLASQIELSRQVAIKILSRQHSSDAGLLRRFQREARALAQLDSPYIVPIHDMFVSDGIFCIVLGYCPGGSVKDLIRAPGIDEQRAAAIACQTALGLWAAAQQGITHRDIKPDNLLLSASGRVKIADFGLVKADASDSAQLTVRGQLMGTPAFMSPEQCEDSHASDHRSDLYSLGCTLFAMLTGRPPFPGPALVNFLKQHVADPPPSLTGRVSPAMAGVVAKLLEKDPAARFQTGAELARALEPLAGDAPHGESSQEDSAELAVAAAQPASGRVSPAPLARQAPGEAVPPPLPAPPPARSPGALLVALMLLVCAGAGVAAWALGWFSPTPPAGPPVTDSTATPLETPAAWAARQGFQTAGPQTPLLYAMRAGLLSEVRGWEAELPAEDAAYHDRILRWGLGACAEFLRAWPDSLRWQAADLRAARDQPLLDALQRAERNLDEWLAARESSEVAGLRARLLDYRADLELRLRPLRTE